MPFDIPAHKAQVDSFYELMTGARARAEVKLGPDKWTLKEMVGHLVDSASNNHQRFIRLQLAETIDVPGYEAESWVAASDLGTLDYGFLVDFWRSYNYYLLHIIGRASPDCMGHAWLVGGESLSLEFLIRDYFDHMELHRRMFVERLAEIEAAGP